MTDTRFLRPERDGSEPDSILLPKFIRARSGRFVEMFTTKFARLPVSRLLLTSRTVRAGKLGRLPRAPSIEFPLRLKTVRCCRLSSAGKDDATMSRSCRFICVTLSHASNDKLQVTPGHWHGHEPFQVVVRLKCVLQCVLGDECSAPKGVCSASFSTTNLLATPPLYQI